jgi:hypothetical protein
MDIQEKNKYLVVGGVILFLAFCGFIVSLNKKILQEAEQVPAAKAVSPTKEVAPAVADSRVMPVAPEETNVSEVGHAPVVSTKKVTPSPAPQSPPNAIQEEPLKSNILVQ